MANHYIGDACVSVGEFTNQNGEVQKKWSKIGAAFESDDGRLSIKFELLPAMKLDDKGYPCAWVCVFPPKDNQQQQSPPRQQYPQERQAQRYSQSDNPPPQSQHQQSKADGYQPQQEESEDIPF